MSNQTDDIDNDELQSGDEASDAREVERVVAFFLGGQRYALPLDKVHEIQQIVAFTEVPEDRSAVVGMVNLRGNVIPAVDMRQLVGLETQEYTLETPMIITDTEGQTVALIVDEVQDVLELPEGSLQEAPPLHRLAPMMIGVVRMPDGLMSLLEIDKLVSMVRGGR